MKNHFIGCNTVHLNLSKNDAFSNETLQVKIGSDLYGTGANAVKKKNYRLNKMITFFNIRQLYYFNYQKEMKKIRRQVYLEPGQRPNKHHLQKHHKRINQY